MEKRLDIIKRYVKTDLVDFEILKLLINETENNNIVRNLLNVYSDFIVHPIFQSCPIDYKIFSNLKILVNNCMIDFNNINYNYLLHKFNNIKKNIEVLSKSLENKDLLNDDWKKLIDLLYKDIYEMEDNVINKKDENYIDNKYDLLSSIIFDTENKTYFNHIIDKYPYLINVKSKDENHIIVDVINKFCDLIKQPNKKNFAKVVYYAEIISTFLESPRFRVNDNERDYINNIISESLESLLNSHTNILKVKQKILFLKSIKEKFIDSESKYDSIRRINAKYNISNGFSISAQREILNINKNPNRTIITIDDDSTLDMDDALSIEKQDDYYILEVYISDVASSIQEGTYLDIEANKRNETIYLSDNTIPMFPFELSNNILSLNNNGYKNVICSTFKIDKYGNIIDAGIRKRQILVTQKLSYDDVNEMLNKGAPIKNYSSNIYKTIESLSEVANILRNRNSKKSSYREMEDLKVKISGTKLSKNEYSYRTKAEIIVEESMVLVNSLPPKILSQKGLPCIYRVHPKIEDTDDFEKLQMLSDIIKLENKNSNNSSYLKLVKELINMYPKAKYSNNNIGHFGLNLDYYSHFSSPIRRYADVVLQRIIYDLLFEIPTDDKIKMWDAKIINLCEHMNSQSSINESYISEYEKAKKLSKI